MHRTHADNHVEQDAGPSRRTSLYLVLRAEALLGALRFFLSPTPDASHRRLQFLAQSDFWEWEVENLIYSFTNLADRQKTWKSESAARSKLGTLGIVVDAKQMHRAFWHRGGWRVDVSGQRVAPVELLRDVVQTWNAVLDLVEGQYIHSMREQAERWNIQAVKDLSHLRKAMPILELEEEP